MVDYYPALKQTVARLASSDRPARFAFYDRAREGLLARLRSIEPRMAEADVRKELSALEAAIQRVESEGHAAPAPDVVVAPNIAEEPGRTDIIPDEPLVLRDDEVGRLPPQQRIALSPRLGVLIAAAIAVVAGLAGYVFWLRERPPAVPVASSRPSAAPAAQAVSSQPSAAPAVQPAPRAKSADTAVVNADDLPYVLRRQLVYYRTSHPVGTIVIEKSQHFLYLVKPNLAAVRYTIGVGQDFLETLGLFVISRGADASASAAARPDTATRMIYFDGTRYRIWSPETPSAIGQDSSLTGVQLLKSDFADLYDRAASSTRVVVLN